MARRHHWPPAAVDEMEDDFVDTLLSAESGYDQAVAELQNRAARRSAPASRERPLYGMGGMAG